MRGTQPRLRSGRRESHSGRRGQRSRRTESHAGRREPHSRRRQPAGGARRRPAGPPVVPELAGRTVLVAGLFPAKARDHAEVMASLAAQLAAHGAVVAGSFVQRRGVSSGGVRAMYRPYSATTLLGSGKLRELAVARAAEHAGAVIFANRLTRRQRTHLADALGCPVIDRTDLAPTAPPQAPYDGRAA